jgi:hypothetical protein
MGQRAAVLRTSGNPPWPTTFNRELSIVLDDELLEPDRRLAFTTYLQDNFHAASMHNIEHCKIAVSDHWTQLTSQTEFNDVTQALGNAIGTAATHSETSEQVPSLRANLQALAIENCQGHTASVFLVAVLGRNQLIRSLAVNGDALCSVCSRWGATPHP